MTDKKLEKRRAELRKEYRSLDRHADRLGWCNEKARELGMSYGVFCSWLGV